MDRARVGAWCGFAAAALAVILVVVASAHRPGYSNASQFISELGEHGTRDGWWVSWLGFAPIGVLAAAAALLMRPKIRMSQLAAVGVVLFGVFTFVGYFGSAVWRCDPGCPENGGSTAQDMHYLVSTIDYVGICAGFLCTAWGLHLRRRWDALFWLSIIGALAVGIVGPFLLSTSVASVRGALQRGIEAVCFLWLIAFGLRVRRDEREAPG